MDKPVNDAPSAVSKSIQKLSGPCTFNMGNIYRERAAMIAHKLALEREQQGATAFTGKAPGEHGDRNTGPLTLPGWGRMEKKRKLDDGDVANVLSIPAAPALPTCAQLVARRISCEHATGVLTDSDTSSAKSSTETEGRPEGTTTNGVGSNATGGVKRPFPGSKSSSESFSTDYDDDDYSSDSEDEDAELDAEICRLQDVLAEQQASIRRMEQRSSSKPAANTPGSPPSGAPGSPKEQES